jgi:hypothetical protein
MVIPRWNPGGSAVAVLADAEESEQGDDAYFVERARDCLILVAGKLQFNPRLVLFAMDRTKTLRDPAQTDLRQLKSAFMVC